MSTAEARLCPNCGEPSAERFCPHDGTITVVRRIVAQDDLAYRPGHVVDGRYRVAGRLGRVDADDALIGALQLPAGWQVTGLHRSTPLPPPASPKRPVPAPPPPSVLAKRASSGTLDGHAPSHKTAATGRATGRIEPLWGMASPSPGAPTPS
ncbi:MAG: hypothetical protein EXR79_09745 [Myxococcales bacterium]|nr:hypothetical protein [Myxococcales bacterium]